MFHHVKYLQFNARVSRPDPRFANLLLEQFGGENGKLAAVIQYFTQAFGAKMPYPDKYDMLKETLGVTQTDQALEQELETTQKLDKQMSIERSTEVKTVNRQVLPTGAPMPPKSNNSLLVMDGYILLRPACDLPRGRG
ncbi:manganese catalase family protein [Mucilaginibacter sp. NFX135]|uniref:manganese catalase family protein n=1 Tax=Mucilaginibacter sp. NFX135 TaxID=3402687 RepID=UPI003AFB6A99